MQNVPEQWREAPVGRDAETSVKRKGDGREKTGGTGGGGASEKESLMMELTRLVQETVKESSWWERRGIDCSILAAAFLLLPAGETLHASHFMLDPGLTTFCSVYQFELQEGVFMFGCSSNDLMHKPPSPAHVPSLF